MQHNNGLSQLRPTEEQYAFGKLMQMAMERLFDSLQVQHKADHRIYEAEIIELSEEVNLILVLPPAQKLVQMSESDPENSLNLQGMNFFSKCKNVSDPRAYCLSDCTCYFGHITKSGPSEGLKTRVCQ